jgi:hypothetical protein
LQPLSRPLFLALGDALSESADVCPSRGRSRRGRV